VRFELFEGNRLVYAIFFGTKSVLGADRMKEAIWRVDPLGGFEFRGGRGCGWIPIRQVRDFVASDRTDYYRAQLRKRTLIPLEDSGLLKVRGRVGTRRKRHTYPDGTELMFD
jgi:hypothetical protein